MKIDLSTLLLVIIGVIPGLFAQRARDLLVPRALTTKGAAEELADLVAFSVITHGVVTLVIACVLLLVGTVSGAGALHLFRLLNNASAIGVWVDQHLSFAILLATVYILTSFGAGTLVGLVDGWIRTQNLIDRIFAGALWLRRLGIRGFLGERPIIYDLLTADVDINGEEKTIFLEAELKGGTGYYSGQLSEFAIVRDEETHRPIYIVEPWYKASRSESYVRLQADGILIDLADVSCLQVKQVSTAI